MSADPWLITAPYGQDRPPGPRCPSNRGSGDDRCDCVSGHEGWHHYPGDDLIASLRRDVEQLHTAMLNAVPLINAAGDSTLKRLWRECGYDTPRKPHNPDTRER